MGGFLKQNFCGVVTWPIDSRSFSPKTCFWTFRSFSAWKWAKLVPMYSKRHLQQDSMLFFSLALLFTTFFLGHAQKWRERENLFHRFQCWLFFTTSTWFWITSQCFSCSWSMSCLLILIQFSVGVWRFPWFRHWRPWWNYCSSPNASSCWQSLVRPLESRWKNYLTFNIHKPTVTSLRLLTQSLLSDWFLLRDTCRISHDTTRPFILGLVGAGKSQNGREKIRENFFPPEFFLARLDFFPTPLTAPGSQSMRPSRIPLCFSWWVTEYLILPF